ncbi:MAG: NUDIX hydrolase [Candidatus Eisenbacteria bacterium]|nr:NUDIX hydrolase [Candidatus Eisenbacteria bacterium]
MSKESKRCPHCGGEVERYRNPFPTVDLILMDQNETGLWLVERRNPPKGWALPGGFVDYGEDLPEAAAREGREETNLEVEILGQFRAYGDPGRDPRFHTVTVVYAAHGRGEAKGGDDALRARFFLWGALPETMAFDHREIIADWLAERG